MDPGVALIVLVAAALNAGWNAMIKVSGDRVAAMGAVTLAGSLLSAPFLLLVEAPAPAAWPLLALTIVLHTLYHLLLPVAYEHGDLGQVYPIARGSAPLLVTLGGALVAGEHLDALPLAGVISLAMGVMALVFDRGCGLLRNPRPVGWALLTGLTIAAYTVVDGLGARQGGSVLGFAVWLTVGDGLLTYAVLGFLRLRAVGTVLRGNRLRVWLAAAMQVGAYWIAVWALARAPLGVVSALRETSVLFGAIVSIFVLREGFGVWRFVSASLVVLGIALSQRRA